MKQHNMRSGISFRPIARAATRVGKGLATALAASLFVAPALADDEGWNYPAPVRTWDVEAGYRIPVKNDSNETSYYRISYRGSLVDALGTPLTPAQHFEITEPKPAAPGGDRSSLELVLENGSASAGGTLLEMNGATPMELAGLEKLHLRGAAYVGADTDGDNLKAAIGLESRPFRVPGLQKTGISNWIVIGVMGERSEATDADTKDSTYGLVTGRLFIGKAFGWRKSSNPETMAQAIEKSILANAPDKDAAQKLAAKLKATPAKARTKPQQTLIDAVDDLQPADNWDDYVHQSARGIADALTDQPTMSVYLEATGWNAFSAQEGIPRHRGLVTLTTDYWPLASRDDIVLRARYEWGFQRASPDVRVNQFMVTLNLQL